MHTIYRLFILFLLIWGASTRSDAQNENFILKRQLFKVPLTSINLSPDGTLLLAGFDDGSFRLLNPDSFSVILEMEGAHTKAVNAMDMPPKMDFILTAGANMIKLWDRSGKHLSDLPGHATTIWNTEISRDGKWAVSSAMNKTFLLWDVNNRSLLEKMRGHTDACLAVSISPDSRFIASAGNDQSILIWDRESRQVISALHGPSDDIYDVEFSPDGNLLVACSKDKSARIYDLKEEKLLHVLKGHTDMVLEAEFSPDGRHLITGSADQSLILWEVESGEKIHQLLENGGAVMDLVFFPDGNSFYSISYARDLTRWGLPEIYVLKYFEKELGDELAADPIFEPRRKGESNKDYQVRMQEAKVKEAEIISRYYEEYLSRQAQ